ncbi:GNAT superfamily N-acetyltransferase/predicted nucleic acid-binding protein [Xanthomonas arboricola]|uniref:GNAT family N-acetyltransferase n=1 Tax=Xanthomonas TaxID=338 RepID=UPI0011B0D6DF|nr:MULTISPECIES: GNAT family N-acetyltransferase [Xanthomonas]MBB5736421.1 GNAT superfamily N-acetyltransferase/predicted nucleic acid-binding protein [Xanthomonas sp. CFBP 8152]
MNSLNSKDKAKAVSILQNWEEVAPYVDLVRAASDSNKKSLGFLPASVFARHARRNQLFVAVDPASQSYLGHLLFDLKFPHATVLQMYADPLSRRRGVAGQLISALKQLLGTHEFLSIRARVAEDLVDANKFWADAGFVVGRRVAGGETTGRKILIRVFELDTPQLFPPSGLTKRGADNLGLTTAGSQALPVYLVDLNVLFDIAHQRANHEAAVSLIRLAHLGEYQLAISDEAGRELDRTAISGHPDPMRGVIESVPRAALVDSEAVEKLIEEVALLIFPEKKYPDGFKRNDISDARHVVTAISHGAAGFVTRDERIVGASEKLARNYGISVLTIEDFIRPLWTDEHKIQFDVGESGGFEVIRYGDVDADAVRKFLLSQGVEAHDITGKWIPLAAGERLAKRVVAKVKESVVGVCCWSRSAKDSRNVSIRISADETLGFVLPMADALLTSVISECCEVGFSSLSLEMPSGQIAAKEVAYGYGFRVNHAGVLRKLATKMVVGPAQWGLLRDQIKAEQQLSLPISMPDWRRYAEPQPIDGADGERRFLSFRDLENLLSPLIFAVEDRPGLVVPIKAKYLERLLGASRQLTFGPKMQAELSRQRVYLGDPRSLKKYQKGALLFFYESGAKGEKSIVAVARVVDAFLIRRDQSALESLSKSVLTLDTLSEIGKAKNKAACLFDNVLWLKNPVSIGVLRNIGIKDGQLITALSLSENQIRKILSVGATA